MNKFERVTRRIGDSIEFVDGKGYANLSHNEAYKFLMETLANREDALNRQRDCVMKAAFNKEEWLYTQKDKPIEMRASIYWGALSVAHKSGVIDWDSMRSMFGEFMSKILNLR